jgi:signal transduction histidine kinase
MEMSHQLLCEPYLDAALHGVLLHPLSQIPDHMPYTYSYRVLLLPSTISTYIVSNIHIIYNNLLWLIEKLGAENFDLVQKIRNVIHDIKSSQGEKADALEIIYNAPNEPIMIEADKTRIYEVVSNLLRNAFKFTDSGTITITSGVEGRNALISIKDTGRSIDPELMPRLFTKFASKSETGTGLGLYLSKKIIEAHGGKIWAENNKDEMAQHLRLLCRF